MRSRSITEYYYTESVQLFSCPTKCGHAAAQNTVTQNQSSYLVVQQNVATLQHRIELQWISVII
jgi:hypothetical protein